MYNRFINLKKKQEKGQGLVEYSLILVLVSIVVIAALMVLGPKIGCLFSSINGSLSGQAGGSCASSGSTNTAYNNHTAIPRMGEPYAVTAFCNTAGSGASYVNYNVGSGWWQTAGPGVSPSTINGGNNAVASTGTCP